MNKYVVLYILLQVFITGLVKADIPQYDIVKLKINNKILYLKCESIGKLQNNDLCYYKYTGEYICEVKQVVFETIRKGGFIFYSQLHYIDLHIFPHENLPLKALFILKGEIKLQVDLAKEKINLLEAFAGHGTGTVYTEDLNRLDNTWIKANKIVKLFDFTNNDPCKMTLYTIQGTITNEESEKLKTNIRAMFKNERDGDQDLAKLLKKLYKRNIIMIGECSY